MGARRLFLPFHFFVSQLDSNASDRRTGQRYMLSLCSSLRTLTRPSTTRRASAPLPLPGRSSDGDKLEAEMGRLDGTERERRGLRPYLHLDLECGGLGLGLEAGSGEGGGADPSAVVEPPPQDLAVVPFPIDRDSLTATPQTSKSAYTPPPEPPAPTPTRTRFSVTPSPSPTSPIHARRTSTSSSVSSSSVTRSITISTPPSSPRSARPPSPLSRRISTRLDSEGRRVLASRRSSGSGASLGDREPEKARRRKKVYGVGDGESSDEDLGLGEGRRAGFGGAGKSTSSPALHLGELGLEEQQQIEFEETDYFSDDPHQGRHHAHRRNSAPSNSPSPPRLRPPPSPITPHFAPLPSPPSSPRGGFSFTSPPLRRGFTMTPLRRSSPSPSPRPSPSTSTTDIRTPAAPSQPPPIPHPKSSPSILRHPAPLEVSASSDVAEGGGAALRRRRTDRRPHQLDVEGVEKVETVVHEHLIEEVDLAQPPSLGGRRLAVTNPDRRSSPPSPIADSLGGGVRSPSPSAS